MSLSTKITKLAKGFNKNSKGTVALSLAIAAVPMFVAAGVGVDYMNASRTQAVLQSAVDSAALAVGYDTDMSEAEMLVVIGKYLKENDAEKILNSIEHVSVVKTGTSGLVVKASGKIDTYLMKMAGIQKMDIHAETYIKNSYGNLEVSLVLDNTWSMSSNGKMNALKSAAKTLVDKLHDNKGASSELKIGLVPFAQYVNIGMSRRNATWADIPADREIQHSYNGYWYRPVVRRYNCHNENRTGYRDGVPYTYTAQVCDYDYGPQVWHNGGTWTEHLRWYGCIGSRNYPLNTKDESPSSKIPGLIEHSKKCPREFTTLTDSKSDIKTEIDNMSVSGNSTYIPAGLMWGWRLLSNDVPITDGVSKAQMVSDNYTKAVVLMTDGENTISPTYPAHTRRDGGTNADTLTKEICENIKDDGTGKEKIRVYTVTFDVTDAATKEMMRKCATNDSYYFDAADSQALADAFEQIGKSLVTLFISR